MRTRRLACARIPCIRRRAVVSRHEQELRRTCRGSSVRAGGGGGSERKSLAGSERRRGYSATARSRRTSGGTRRLHGVARAGAATVFPQAIGLAATFDPSLMPRSRRPSATRRAPSTEESMRRGQRPLSGPDLLVAQHQHLSRSRDGAAARRPTAKIHFSPLAHGRRLRHGMQGDDPRYLKVVATAKHYAVHSGPEPDAHHSSTCIHRARSIFTRPTCRRSAPSLQEAHVGVGHGCVQPRQRRVRFGEPAAVAGHPAEGVGLRGLCRLRLRLDRRHLPASTRSWPRRKKPRRSASSRTRTIAARPSGRSATPCTRVW